MPSGSVYGRLGTSPGAGPGEPVPITSLLSAASQSAANRVFAGPTSGGAGAATFRSLIAADFPQMAGSTLWGNPTGSAATPQAFTIQGLTNLPSPSSTLDYLLIYDHSTGALKSVSASQLPGLSSPLNQNNTWTGTNAFNAAVSFTAATSFTSAPTVDSPTGTPTAIRVPLSSGTVIYVNATGGTAACGTTGALTCGVGSSSPANPTAPSTPFDTTNHAIAWLQCCADAQGTSPTINLAHGSSVNYAINCLGQPLLGNITFFVVGDYNSPTAVKIVSPNSGYGVFAKDQCVPSLSALEIDDQGSAAGGVFSDQQGIIDLRSVTFGNFNSGAAPIIAWNGGKVNLLGADASSPSRLNTLGTSYVQAVQVQFAGIIDFNGQQVSIPSAMTISGNFAYGAGGYFKGLCTGAGAGCVGATFTGAGVAGTTGSRCAYANTYSGGTNPNSVFPGNANCTPTTSTY